MQEGQELDVLTDPNLDLEPSGTLVILKAKVEDSGQYSCLAMNPAGEDGENMQLRVEGET